jgi:hypothetical protein
MADKTVPMRLKAEPSCSIATAKNISKTNSLLYTSAAAAILKTNLSATAATKVWDSKPRRLQAKAIRTGRKFHRD